MALPLLALLALAAAGVGTQYQLDKSARKSRANKLAREEEQFRNRQATLSRAQQSPVAQKPQPRPQPAPAPAPTNVPATGNALLDEIIRRSAKKYGFHPRLFDAIIATESSYNPKAFRQEPPSKSYPQGTASYGLGQTLEPTARALGLEGNIEQLYEPATSVDFIGRYLADKQRAFPKANWNDAETIYRIYNTGNPAGNFYPGAKDNFLRNYVKSKTKNVYGR